MSVSSGTSIEIGTMRALAIPSANDRACLAMGLLGPGAECGPGHGPASQYKIQPGEGMGERQVGLSGATLRRSFPFT